MITDKNNKIVFKGLAPDIRDPELLVKGLIENNEVNPEAKMKVEY